MYIIIKVIFTLFICKAEADIMTNFDDKKDVKISMFGFDNQIPPDKFQHWIYDGKVSASPIAFEPPNLDFPETPIGQPKWEHVKIINEDESSSIKLLSISSNTIDFHCSFFKEEVIVEGGNSSFDIVFLSRQLGEIQSTLFIHTSKGTFQYKVAAVGIPSPYRIKSFVKARIPLNSSFSSPIHFYNPYNYPIQILEMYTSGGDAHLELPNNGKQASKKFWTVPPYETRTLMKVKFLGRKVGNFTSFIRIRTNTTDNSLGFVIPLQIEISNKSSLYCTHDILYFGILRTLDSPKVLKLQVVNSGKDAIRIKNVSLTKPNDAITIDFHQLNVPPGIYQQTLAATITFSAFKATSELDYSGTIIIETFQNTTLQIPFCADIIHGSLVYDANNTKFFSGIGELKTETRSIAITNTFDFTIAIYSISLPAKSNNCFKILNLTLPIFIKSQMTEKAIEIQFDAIENLNPLITQMAIFSNASLFVIPLFVYDGKLTIISHRPEMYKGYLDFGTLGLNIDNSLHFTIKNENPIEIILFSMSTNWYLATVLLIGVEKGNNTLLQKNSSHLPMNIFVPLILKPYHFAVFRLNVQTPDTKGVFASDISIVTSYENISIPYYLRTTDGVISSVNPLTLKNSFPSKTSKLLLTLNSSFQSYIELTSVKFIPNDTRFDFDPKSGRKLPILINPIESTSVGYLTFSPDNNCIDSLSNDFIDLEKPTSNANEGANFQFRILTEVNGKVPCYVGFSVCTKLGYQWLNSVSMNSKTHDIDHFIYKRLHQQWEVLKSTDNQMFNVTMQMDTSNIKGFLYNVQIQFIWPSLLSSSKPMQFPLTQIGNYSFKDINLENPSDKSVLIQLIFISQYSDPYSILELMGISDKDIYISNSDLFTLHPKKAISDKYVYTESAKENNKIKKLFSIVPLNESMMVYLSPKSKQRIRIYFNPAQEHFGLKISSYILLRNNLTGIETLRLEGEGTYGELSFQCGQFPEETSVLNFDLTEKHLKSCDSQSKGLLPSFTVRRPFVIKNIGKIPVYILGFQFGPFGSSYDNQGTLETQINDSISASLPTVVLDNVQIDTENSGESMWCAGYGFEILECYEHRLEVNETLKLEIVFTPDFSLHKVIQQLQIHTSLSERPFNITVHATLPAHMLHRCSQALARPDSEVLIWYMGIVVLSIVSLASIIMSYYEADRIFTSNVIYRHLSSVAVGNYPHSSNDRMCDIRTLVSKNSPFIGASSQIHVGHKSSSSSSFQDYLSSYNNRSSFDSSTVKRVNICKKYDERLSSSLTEKQFSQSFCGRSISDDTTNSDCNINSLISSTIHQHKKKKKRSLISSLIQWIIRSFTQIVNQQSALKPKLDDGYMLNYKNDAQSITKSQILVPDTKCDDNKVDLSSKMKTKLSCNSSESTTTTNNMSPINTVSNNNNSNHQSHSKKLKNRSNYTMTSNLTKVTNKQNDQAVATLNFAPIDIPALDLHKCKKIPINKKPKKASSVTMEETKVKTSLRMDDSISISTDSSTEEKIKEIEGNKGQKTGVIRCFKSKQELKMSNSTAFDESSENKLKLNICSELDDECSIKSNDSGIDSTRNACEWGLERIITNRKVYPKPQRDVIENSYLRSVKQNLKTNEQNTSVVSGIENCKHRKITCDGKLKTFKEPRSFACSRDMTINEDNTPYEIKDDNGSDECIQWEHEHVRNVSPDDFSMLSATTELFSNSVAMNNDANLNKTVHNDERPPVNLKSNVENWLSATNTQFNNISTGKYELKVDERNYCQSYGDDLPFKTDPHQHSCQESMFSHYYKHAPVPSLNLDGFRNNALIPHKLCHEDIFNQDVMPHFMTLELPGIAHGRKQSLLEYERRLQQEITESERLATMKENYISMTKSVNKFWDIHLPDDSGCQVDQVWNSNEEYSNQSNCIMNNCNSWSLEKCWNNIEPGSQHDPLARTLLPVGLLSNDNPNGMMCQSSQDNLWKYKSEDNNNNEMEPTDNYVMDSMERL